ncbi:FG-GAP repeat protein [Vibrio metschnikovii]|nr:FG-GAP repeat protein [Vibrio metschnikovii]
MNIKIITTLVISNDLEAGDYLGRSVSISGNYAIVGAESEATGGYAAGAAYIFAP